MEQTTMCPMPDPPAEDPAGLSDDLLVEDLDDVQLLGILLCLSSKEVGMWVGMAVQALAEVIEEPGTTSPILHPMGWLSLNTNHRLASAAREARAEGLITLEDGFAYPTQKLVDQLLAASS